jgi:hypothetical protein
VLGLRTILLVNDTISSSLEIVYDSPESGFAAQSVSATATLGAAITAEDYYNSIPHVSDSNYATVYERPGVVMVDANGQAISGRPTTFFIDNVQYLNSDGSLAQPFSGLEYVLLGTGAGQPEIPGVPGVSSPQSSVVTQAAACGSSTATIRFTQVRDYDYSYNPPKKLFSDMPKGTYFRAVDNATFVDPIIHQGYVGDNGIATFTYPNCDPAGTGQADVYFIFETRNDIGLTASHGTVTRRHWWRTNTYWDFTASQLSALPGIKAIGDNAEAINTQRLWYKVNRVYDWDRQAFSDVYTSFRLDVLYPVFTYFGASVVSRAALGQVQMVYADANFDDVIFHEFGHEVYYRRMMGEAAYNQAHSCSASAVCTVFPLCGGCIGHSLLANSGPEAGMIEGWADFFEAVTVQHVPATNVWSDEDGNPFFMNTYIENFDRYPWEGITSIPTGQGVEARVAAYLWDFWDPNLSTFQIYDNDEVVTIGTAQERYRKVGGYFMNMSISSAFSNVWRTNIKPNLSPTDVQKHRSVLFLNTLGGVF